MTIPAPTTLPAHGGLTACPSLSHPPPMPLFSAPARDPADPLGRLLDGLHREGGFDFTGYQRPYLARRVAVRMHALDIPDLQSYADYLHAHPAERTALCHAIWINVTEFFRDPSVWDHLRAHVLPAMIARAGTGAPVRVWSAGCSTGQEAYSLVLLLADALGPGDLRGRVEIFATDVDGEALARARRGAYTDREMAGLPSPWRETYFRCSADGWRVRAGVRRPVTFRRSDLLRARPRGRFDLIVCRNTLMYFRPEAQVRVLAGFHRALTEGGHLLLGPAEGTIFHDHGRAYPDRFAPVDLDLRLYARPQ